MVDRALAAHARESLIAAREHGAGIVAVGGGKAIGARHAVKVVVLDGPCLAVAGGDHVDAVLLERAQIVAEIRPAGDTVPRNAVLLLHWESGGALLDVLLHLSIELLHDGCGRLLAAVADHSGHIVEQLEAADGRGLVVHQVVGALPEIAVALGDLHDLLEALIVPGLAGEGAQVRDELVDLRAHVAHARFGDVVHGVIAGVDEKYGDIELTGEVFVPLGQLVADVVRQQKKVGLDHLAAVGQLHAALAVQNGGVGEVELCIGAEVVGIAHGAFALLQKRVRLMARGDACRVVFGVEDVQPQRFGDLLRENGGRPADLFAALLGELRVFKKGVRLLADHQKGLCFGMLGFCGCCGGLRRGSGSGIQRVTHWTILLSSFVFPMQTGRRRSHRRTGTADAPERGSRSRAPWRSPRLCSAPRRRS